MLDGWWREARDLWVELAVWLAIAAVAFYFTFDFDEPLDIYRFGAASWPRVVIAALAIGAVVQFLRSLLMRRDRENEGLSSYWSRIKGAGFTTNVKLVGTFAVPLLYVYLLPKTGYYATTPFFLSGYMFLMGERRLLHLIGSSLLIYGISLLIFAKLLFVALPVGNWPGFYHFSNWLLVLIR
ncbi:MAG: tripartite tricarboxylate transporter TctB family protein [Acidiferrobacterales bacterium]